MKFLFLIALLLIAANYDLGHYQKKSVFEDLKSF